MDIIYWLIVIIGYIVSLYFLLYSFVIGISFFNQVPFVPLESKSIRYALELLDLKPTDKFLDIGSGDGRVVRSVLRKIPGISVSGIEYSWLLNNFARIQSIFFPKANLINADAFSFSYKGYNKVFMYLTSEMVTQILPKVVKEGDQDLIIISSYFKPLDKVAEVTIKEKKYQINGKIKSFFVITKDGNNDN